MIDARVRVIPLSGATKGNYVSKRGGIVVLAWFFVEALIINNRLMPISAVRVALLRVFGAKIGRGCRFLHAIRVKCPWDLVVGEDTWIGEGVWIYNQDTVTVGSNVCISQETFLTNGSHDAGGGMDLQVAPIVICDGVWITSRCVIQKGVTIGESALVTPNSVVHKSLAPGGIYGGNPCAFLRSRFASAEGGAEERSQAM
jgi:putative colanic acid biosynthesis acetyltransferase WcaF